MKYMPIKHIPHTYDTLARCSIPLYDAAPNTNTNAITHMTFRCIKLLTPPFFQNSKSVITNTAISINPTILHTVPTGIKAKTVMQARCAAINHDSLVM